MKPSHWLFEQGLWKQNYSRVAGVDEVGRGCIAGPVVAAAVWFPAQVKFPTKLYDSKLLNSAKREELAQIINTLAGGVGIGLVETKIINTRGIVTASQLAFRRAVKHLSEKPDYLLIDAFYIRHFKKDYQLPIVKGDQVSASISAASIIAKVYRDQLMTSLHRKVPNYRFDLHKGYATKLHQEMIKAHGVSPHHRTSWDFSFLNG
jgi:ribonuclease HII